MIQKVRREIKILKRFHHHHIIRLYEAFEVNGKIYLVMEYVPLGELYNVIERRGRLPESEARKYFQ
jgi:serine/threonine protein kinase